ncbi:MAG TPA: metallophosphoesterase, partial [Blastocatellia bacterium]|nr:metallophosphoesterase [Blastocatellia bacterium]
SNKDYTYFNQEDIERALDFGRPDILLVHDWPARVIAIEDAGEFEQQRRSMRYTSVGNEYARVLMDLLSPKLVLCGHMHKKYRNQVTTKSGAAVEICCLANVERGEDSVAFFRSGDNGVITEVVD